MTETIQEIHIATTPNKPAKQKKLWIGVVGGIVALSVLVVGFQAYKKYSFKSALRPYALKDNILAEDILNIESNGKITIADYLDKAKKNIEAREQLIQDVRMVDPGSNKKELDMLVEIMTLENEYAQSMVADITAYLDLKKAENLRIIQEESCNRYWYSACGRDMLEVKNDVESASTRWAEKIREKRETAEKWLSKENNYDKALSAILPARNLIPKLDEIVLSNDQNAKVSKLWFYSFKDYSCNPVKAGGLPTPEHIIQKYPECKIDPNKAKDFGDGILFLDCFQSKLESYFLYGDSKESCLRAAEIINKRR